MFTGGGGLWIGDFDAGGAAVTMVNSDFGFGFVDENIPEDVFAVFNVMPESYGFYGDGVSFTCDEGMCVRSSSLISRAGYQPSRV